MTQLDFCYYLGCFTAYCATYYVYNIFLTPVTK